MKPGSNLREDKFQDGQEVDSTQETIQKLIKAVKTLNRKITNVESQNKTLEQTLKNHRIASAESEIDLKKQIRNINEEKFSTKKSQEFSIEKELNIYEGMSEVKKLDMKLDKFIEHYSIKQKRMEKDFEKLEEFIARGGGGGLSSSKKEIEEEINERSLSDKIPDPQNPTTIERIKQDYSVLKRDIWSLTEVQRVLADVWFFKNNFSLTKIFFFFFYKFIKKYF